METVLSSASNPLVKQLRKLSRSGKERREANLYIAEGIHLAQSFLASGRVPKMYVYAASAQRNHEVAELLEELAATTAQKVAVSDSVFESVSSVEPVTGICIVFELPEVPLEEISPLKTAAVLLENIQDPGNLGTILRTAAAVGMQHVLLSPDCASPWSPKALRSGMGAQFSLTIHEEVSLEDTLRTTKVPIAATILGSGSVSLYEVDLRQPVAWLFGSEGQGLSDTLASAAQIKVTIPQEANSVESLNVASAATVCLYEQYRQKISG